MASSSRGYSSIHSSRSSHPPDDPFDMFGNGSSTDPKVADAGKAAVVEVVETSATARQERIEMHNGETCALDAMHERYLRHGIENLGSPEFTELLELYLDRVYAANIATAAKTSVCMRSGGGHPCDDRHRDGSGNETS
eukprot:jgi/Tetstr1/431120/TSEL_020835.t1